MSGPPETEKRCPLAGSSAQANDIRESFVSRRAEAGNIACEGHRRRGQN
jgi:hypothetical protein